VGEQMLPVTVFQIWKDEYEREEFCMESDVKQAFKDLDKGLDDLDKKLSVINVGIKRELQDLGADIIKLMDMVKRS
jgi:hypothetical protein